MTLPLLSKHSVCMASVTINFTVGAVESAAVFVVLQPVANIIIAMSVNTVFRLYSEVSADFQSFDRAEVNCIEE